MPDVLFYSGDKIPGGAGRLPAGWTRINSTIDHRTDRRRGLVFYRHDIELPGWNAVWLVVKPTDDKTAWQWLTRGQRVKSGPRDLLAYGGPFTRAVDAMTAADEHARGLEAQ